MEDKQRAALEFMERSKLLKKSLQRALPLVGRNPILMEPKFIGMIVAICAGDDPVLAKEFNNFLKESGSLNIYDMEELDKFFWNWLKHKYPKGFETKKPETSFPGEGSMQRLGEALKEELEEKYEKESEVKIQHAKDTIRKELTQEFNEKIKEVVHNTGQTSKSLNSMDAIIEKGGKSALDQLSDHIELAKGSTNRIQSSADDLQAKVKKLEEQIQYDTIPGLYTVHIFSTKFQEMANRFTRENAPFSLIFLTIDHLDQFTSSSDPMIARKLFLGIAQQIIQELQSYHGDTVPARYDANLMGILLPKSKISEAFKLADKILKMIKEQEFTTKGGQSLNLTLSIGIAEYAKHDSFGFEEIPGGGKQLSSTIFNRAIAALDKAQADGGNRIEDGEKAGVALRH